MRGSRSVTFRFLLGAAGLVALGALSLGVRAQNPPPADSSNAPPEGDAWPRQATIDGMGATVYQPQVESWAHNLLTARAAVSLQDKAAPTPIFGVVWLTARTEVDKETHQVTLEDIKVSKVNFPSKPDKTAEFQAMLTKALPTHTKTVSLDRLQASLAVNQAESATKKLPLKNDPPRIIYSTRSAVLVLVDDKPVLRKVDGSNMMRIINTRALILFDPSSAKYYLYFMDRWMETSDLEGTWTVSNAPPPQVNTIKGDLENKHAVDLLDDPSPELKQELEEGLQPTIYVSTKPAELIETKGDLQFASIDKTQLLWVTNTDDDILYDTAGQNYYVRLSGRWFRAKVLIGPWAFVPGDKLPPDFAKVPENHPKGEILAAVANTPQAQQAVIANSIPQTATIKRADTTIKPVYDGAAQFQPIEDTTLQYAANTATPVIRVADNSYYAIENGVWFTAAAADGPWAVATAVPPVIYTIPPSNPLYYVTYAQVYGFTPDYVYVGYTPGYFGTCVAPYGCLVYGTGWNYRPWIGTTWYGRPWSYGYAASVHWSPATGWGFGYGARVGGPWWGPAGWGGYHGGAWHAGWAGGYASAYGGRYANVHGTRVNVGGYNAYNRWAAQAVDVHHTSFSNTNINRANVNTANINRANINNTNINRTEVNRTAVNTRQLNNVYAGADGSVYRRSATGWERNDGGVWKSYGGAAGERTAVNAGSVNRTDINRTDVNRTNVNRSEFNRTDVNRTSVDRLNSDFYSRRAGEMNYSNFRSGGSFGGYRGSYGGGFRGGRR